MPAFLPVKGNSEKELYKLGDREKALSLFFTAADSPELRAA